MSKNRYHNGKVVHMDLGLIMHFDGIAVEFADDGSDLTYLPDNNFNRERAVTDAALASGRGPSPKYIRDQRHSFLEHGWDMKQGIIAVTKMDGYGPDAIPVADSAEYQENARLAHERRYTILVTMGEEAKFIEEREAVDGSIRRIEVTPADQAAAYELIYRGKDGAWKAPVADGVSCFTRCCSTSGGGVLQTVAVILAEERTRVGKDGKEKPAVDFGDLLKRLTKVPVLVHDFPNIAARAGVCATENNQEVGKRETMWLDDLKTAEIVYREVKAERLAEGKAGVPENALSVVSPKKGRYEKLHKILTLNDMHPDLKILQSLRAKGEAFIASLRTNDLRDLVPSTRGKGRKGGTEAEVSLFFAQGKTADPRNAHSGAQMRTFARELGDVLGGILIKMSRGEGQEVLNAFKAGLAVNERTVADIDAQLSDLLGVTFRTNFDDGECQLEADANLAAEVAKQFADNAIEVAE